MTVRPFNTGWSYRQPLGPFAAAQGEPPTPIPVTLPHDALRDAERSPDVPAKGAGAYYPPGAYTYLKTFDAPPDWVDKTVQLEFRASTAAMVFVNDEFAGQPPMGTRASSSTQAVLPQRRNEVRVEGAPARIALVIRLRTDTDVPSARDDPGTSYGRRAVTAGRRGDQA